jgi:hypothetical protein
MLCICRRERASRRRKVMVLSARMVEEQLESKSPTSWKGDWVVSSWWFVGDPKRWWKWPTEILCCKSQKAK